MFWQKTKQEKELHRRLFEAQIRLLEIRVQQEEALIASGAPVSLAEKGV